MKSRHIYVIAIVIIFTSCIQQIESRLHVELAEDITLLSGEYLGQTPPLSTPILFSPNIISTGLVNRDITFSPKGDEIYFTFATTNYSYATILTTKQVDDEWSTPEVAFFANNTDYITIEPCYNYDGNLLFFASKRPTCDTIDKVDTDIWVISKENELWGLPILLDSTINTVNGEFYPSLTKKGDLYFTREEPSGKNYIYKSEYINGKFTMPQKLPKQINCGRNRFNAYVSPDEDFIIIPALGVEENIAGVNYYISFKNISDNWSNPINMGNMINEDLGRGWSASISHDGKYLFFMSSKGLPKDLMPKYLTYDFLQEIQSLPQNGNADIYWVNTNFIDDLRLKATFGTTD